MKINCWPTKTLLAALLLASCQQPGSEITTLQNTNSTAPAIQWKIHDMNRPKPMVIRPLTQPLPAPAPPGAILLFNGGSLSQWNGKDSSGAPWKTEKDYMEIVPGSGGIETKERFGDVLLHIEWASPDDTTKKGQNRGNSGIFFMGRYEMQVLDSYQADTYADGQAGAIYGQAPPRFNACQPRGQWNVYDIAFRRPRFAANGSVITPARITAIHNGIIIQDNEEFLGPTSWLKYLPYESHADKLPFSLQEHNGKVRYRNIWALPLPELSAPVAMDNEKTSPLSEADLDKFTGTYERPNAKAPILITKSKGVLYADFFWRPGVLELVPAGSNEFALKETAGTLTFVPGDTGNTASLVFHLGGDDMPATKVLK